MASDTRSRSTSELISRDTLIECLLARVQECEEEKVGVEQSMDKLKGELQQLRETNMMLHSSIKSLQVSEIRTGVLLPDRTARRDSRDEEEMIHVFSNIGMQATGELEEISSDSVEEIIPLSSSFSSSSDTSSFSSSSLSSLSSPDFSPRPQPITSVDELLAFLVWLFLHIAVFIDSHRRVYYKDKD